MAPDHPRTPDGSGLCGRRLSQVSPLSDIADAVSLDLSLAVSISPAYGDVNYGYYNRNLKEINNGDEWLSRVIHRADPT